MNLKSRSSLFITRNYDEQQAVYIGKGNFLHFAWIKESDGTLDTVNINNITIKTITSVNNITIEYNYSANVINITCLTNDTNAFLISVDYVVDSEQRKYSVLYYLRAINYVGTVGISQIESILRQELPLGYSIGYNYQSGNYLDIKATSEVLNKTYETLYELRYSLFPQKDYLGLYPLQWESALNNSKNIITFAVYPSQIIRLLWQVRFQTGITRFDLTLFLAKFAYYWTGTPIVVWIDLFNTIKIYKIIGDTWILEVDPYTTLYDNTATTGSTILGNDTQDSVFEYLIGTYVFRLMPVDYKYNLLFSDTSFLDIDLTRVGWTYRENYNTDIQALAYYGDQLSPINILGYKPND